MSRSAIIKRILISLGLGLLLGVAINEITFVFLKESARPPQEVELVIPPGTADRIEQGDTASAIPDSLSLVLGDTLVVRNEDGAAHQLGPLWIPAGASASLLLDTIDNYAYSCSFRPSKYLGLDVHEPLTLGTRLEGIFFTGVPLGVLFSLYSIILSPARKPRPV